jgi:hypothetical protein
MPRDREALLRRSARAEAMLRFASTHGHITESYASAARCSLGEAVVELLRLERECLIERSRNGYGMTWRAVR